MKVDFGQVIKNLDKTDAKEVDAAKERELAAKLAGREITMGEYSDALVKLQNDYKSLTIKTICVNALLTEMQDEQKSGDWDKKLERGRLAEAIYDSEGEFELKAEQITVLKKRIGKLYLPLIVLRAERILEGKTDGGTD